MDQNRVDRAARLFLGAAAGAAAAGAAVGWYAAKVEPHQLTVTRPELCRRPPVRTLFFSDVHFGPMYSPEFLEPLVDAINAEASRDGAVRRRFLCKVRPGCPHAEFFLAGRPAAAHRSPFGQVCGVGQPRRAPGRCPLLPDADGARRLCAPVG